MPISPWERHFRDVQSVLVHAPQEDTSVAMLGRAAFDRWQGRQAEQSKPPANLTILKPPEHMPAATISPSRHSKDFFNEQQNDRRFLGNISRPSSTRRFVEHVTENLAHRTGLQHKVFDVEDLGPSLATARSVADLDAQAHRLVKTLIEAEALVIGSPLQGELYGCSSTSSTCSIRRPQGKPVILTATVVGTVTRSSSSIS